MYFSDMLLKEDFIPVLHKISDHFKLGGNGFFKIIFDKDLFFETELFDVKLIQKEIKVEFRINPVYFLSNYVDDIAEQNSKITEPHDSRVLIDLFITILNEPGFIDNAKQLDKEFKESELLMNQIFEITELSDIKEIRKSGINLIISDKEYKF